jgi:protein TonB
VIGGVIVGDGHGPQSCPSSTTTRARDSCGRARPEYPHDAFTKKIEGVVVVEILIDDTGRVARMRIVQSVPLLDAAALDAVRQWIFLPAVRHGRAGRDDRRRPRALHRSTERRGQNQPWRARRRAQVRCGPARTRRAAGSRPEQAEDALDGDPDQTERQEDQPDQRIQDEGQQGEGPAHG